MKRSKILRIGLGIIAGTLLLTFSGTALADPMLKMAFIETDSPLTVKKLARMGMDIAAVRKIGEPGEPVRYRVEVVVSERDQKKLQRAGVKWRLVQEPAAMRAMPGQTAAESVYHSFDEPVNGIRDQLEAVAETHPKLARLETFGHSIQRRPMLALCLTRQKTGKWKQHGKKKPGVLILATHHAREWVATQMAMRLINYLTENYGVEPRVTHLLDTTEVWFVPVANPDGYQYTFDHERLWRKNLRDNDGDGEITTADGVDLNRNFGAHWGLDDEGSSPVWSDGTYRGTAPNSEPENQAVVDFVLAHDFKFILSYHTYSDLILYPWGWQVKTPSFDDPIFVAQAGTDDNPAIWDSLLGRGYDPGVGADLYITNGDFTDWTYSKAGIPSHTVELTLGEDGEGDFYGFEFPDDEAMVQTVFRDNLEFALCLMESARDPAHPKSPVGIAVEEIYHEPLTTSYGRNQLVDVLAPAKQHNRLLLFYSVNHGRFGLSFFSPMLGSTYNDTPGVYYTGYRAEIKNQQAGDDVTYWILGRGAFLGPYSYTVAQATQNNILVVSAEDYSGTYPDYDDPTQPAYLSYYTDALDSAGLAYDVWDVTGHEGAPAFREVLSNYKSVIWYTGDDYAATVPGMDVHEEIVLGLRDFMNFSRGTLLATGQDLMAPAASYGLLSDDFFQYSLGAYMAVDGGGIDPDSEQPFQVIGEAGDPVFDGLTLDLSGTESANNQIFADTFLLTSYFLPHFDDSLSARYVRPGGPFEPRTGDYYVYSQMADMAYKRLGGAFTLPDSSPELRFWVSFDIEQDWDYVFVEVHDLGSDTWTTLPDANGLTGTGTGDSCASDWVGEIHPHLAHYMDGDCNPTGTTGQWNAMTGNSAGWQEVVMDLSAYAGRDVEIFIAYASDWGTQGLGMFVDDITLTGYEPESFETGLGMFEITAPPENNPLNNWTRMQSGGFAEGPVVRTPNSVFMGFGFEAVNGVETRAMLMQRLMDYLLTD